MKHIAITLSLLAIAMIPLRGGDWYDGGLWQAPTMSHYTRVLVPSTNRTATRKCSPSLPKYVRSTRI